VRRGLGQPHRLTRAPRFGTTERAVHWSFALLLFTLLGSGLVLWVPPLSEAAGHRAGLRQAHIVAGLALVPVPLLVALVGDRPTVLATARQLERFGGTPRFNDGQRLNTAWTATSAVLFLITGVIQWRWPSFPADWRTGASRLHDLLTVVTIVVVTAHVALALLHLRRDRRVA